MQIGFKLAHLLEVPEMQFELGMPNRTLRRRVGERLPNWAFKWTLLCIAPILTTIGDTRFKVANNRRSSIKLPGLAVSDTAVEDYFWERRVAVSVLLSHIPDGN